MVPGRAPRRLEDGELAQARCISRNAPATPPWKRRKTGVADQMRREGQEGGHFVAGKFARHAQKTDVGNGRPASSPSVRAGRRSSAPPA